MPDEVSRRRFVALAGVSATAGMAGCAVDVGSETETPEELDVGTPMSTDDAPDESVSGGRFAEIFEQTRDAVVQIRVRTPSGSASGTGWLIDESRLVTNQHVVADATQVFVRFRSGGWITATVTGTDVYSDLAVMQVEEKPEAATPLPLQTTDPSIGTEVLAIGNPFGLSGSVSSGIVSGVNRTLPAGGGNNFQIPDAIQTDAPVNPGNSGGPLVDLDGDVIGVINSGGGDNIAFAISGALVDRVVPALIEDGDYDHPYLGIRLENVTPALGRANDLSVARGVYVHEVVADSPAAGVLEGSDGSAMALSQQVPTGGDVIVRLAGRPIPTQQALASALALHTTPGETVDIEVIRDGERQTVQLTIGQRPDPSA